MDRRDFVKNTTVALCVTPFVSLSGISTLPAEQMPDWILALIKQNDKGILSLRNFQVKDPSSPDLGGIRDGSDLLNAHGTSAMIQSGACSISSPSSQFYRSAELLNDMNLAAKYLLKIQHDDGTIDLLSTNFHSTPDTGFLVKRLTMSYKLILQSKTPGQEEMLANLKKFLLKGGEALAAGGIHTPNHRWVVSAALSRLNSLWPNPKYAARINQWLGEHIDIDQDGQYNEKSTFIYSSLSNRVLMTIAREFNKPELLDIVRKNLDMTMFYVHPNGEIVTDASGRQDKALVGTLENYYYPYRYLAQKDKNPAYAAMCELIEKTAGIKIGSFLDYYLTDPSLWAPLPAKSAVPVDYVKTFPHSGLVRIRRNKWDSTIIAKNPVWLTFMNGNAVLQGVRFAASFFGKGQFQTDAVVKTDTGWELTQKLLGPYWQPLPPEKIVADGDWEKMSKTDRPQSEVQSLDVKIAIREIKGGVEVEITTIGTEGVPTALELIFRGTGSFTGLTKIENTKDSWLLKEGMGTYTSGLDSINFGPGIALHKNIALRGSLPAMDAPTVYLTGLTPFHHVLRLT